MKTVEFLLRISPEERDAIKKQAAKEDRSMANLIRRACSLYIEPQESIPAPKVKQKGAGL